MVASKSRGHILAVAYPSQGHLTPIRQFCKRLHSKGFKTTHTITTFLLNTIKPNTSGPISIDIISDGYDQGGFPSAPSIETYLQDFKTHGSKTISDIIIKNQNTDDPITCLVYDSFMPWALDIAREFGIVAAPIFTQPCAVNYFNYLCFLNGGVISHPVKDLPFLDVDDMPTFDTPSLSHPAYFKMILDQFSNFEKADCVLINTYLELDLYGHELMSKVCPILTVGPTVPSMFIDKRIEFDNDYDLNLFDSKEAALCTNWLNTRPEASVVYVAFGSMAQLTTEQMTELALALKSFSFLWVVRGSEEAKIPSGYRETIDKDKSLMVKWSPQLQVLSNKAVGCFVTHCGWNSTMEALSLGTPMVPMPQWTDQPMNAKYIQDVWKAGVRVKADKETGIASKEEIEFAIREVMEGEKSKEIKANAMKWKDLAVKSLSPGGSSDLNIDEFVSKI